MAHPDFRVNKRIFASLHSRNQFGMVKLTPDQQERFVEEHPDMFVPETLAWQKYKKGRQEEAPLEPMGTGSGFGVLRFWVLVRGSRFLVR